MKFKNEENMNYIIDTNDDNTVEFVKKELSKSILIISDDIVLVFRNRILNDKVMIREYNIGPDEFVMFYPRYDYMAKGLSIVSSTLKEQIDSKFMDQMTKFMIKSLLSFSQYRRKSICGVAIYLHFHCVNVKTKPTIWTLQSGLIVEQVKAVVAKEIDIPSKNIGLFQDKHLQTVINSNEVIDQVCKSICRNASDKIDIYYQIIADLDNLIKGRLLGCGSFGKTFKCREITSNRRFALKRFAISIKEAEQVAKLNKVIDNLCSLPSHQRIVKFVRQFEKKKSLYTLMEYMAGDSLSGHISCRGPLPDDEISRFSKQILEGLEYLHKQGIVHGNIKGNNVLLDVAGNAKLSDYGLRILIDIASSDSLNGAAQSNVGTFSWIAPEVLLNGECSPRSDIWSFGVTVVEMLTGMPPFQGWSMFHILLSLTKDKKIIYTEPEAMSDLLRDFVNSSLISTESDRPMANELLRHGFIAKYQYKLQYNCALQ